MSETFSGQTRNEQLLNTTDVTVGNITTGVDTLQTYSLPAGQLSSNGDILEIMAAGSYANTANNKQVILSFGGTSIVATGAAAQQNGAWIVRATVLRTGAATQRVIATHFTQASSGVTRITYTATAIDLTAAATVLLTGEATATDDITCTMFTVKLIPSAVVD